MGASQSELRAIFADDIVDFNGSGRYLSSRLDSFRWHLLEAHVRLVPDASIVDPIKLWVDHSTYNSVAGKLFRKHLRSCGWAPLLDRWKMLRGEASSIAVWARISLLGKKWAGYRNKLGEICRALRTFQEWSIAWQSKDAFWPPCTSCGMPTSCYCDYCRNFERGFGDNALCPSCDNGNNQCIFCFREVVGSTCRF